MVYVEVDEWEDLKEGVEDGVDQCGVDGGEEDGGI